MGLIRLYAIGFMILTIIYIFLSLRGRWQCRNRLEAEFDTGGIEGSRDDYVADGLKEFEGSLRRKLVLLVYVLPMLAVLTLIYVTNFM